MYNDIVKTKILIDAENWRGLKGSLTHSVALTKLLSWKMERESGFASKVFPTEKTQKFPLQYGSGDGRF